MPDERLAFPLEALLAAGERERALSVCDLGHLVVAGRTHWRPVALTPDCRGLVCDWTEHADG